MSSLCHRYILFSTRKWAIEINIRKCVGNRKQRNNMKISRILCIPNGHVRLVLCWFFLFFFFHFSLETFSVISTFFVSFINIFTLFIRNSFQFTRKTIFGSIQSIVWLDMDIGHDVIRNVTDLYGNFLYRKLKEKQERLWKKSFHPEKKNKWHLQWEPLIIDIDKFVKKKKKEIKTARKTEKVKGWWLLNYTRQF